MLPNLLNMALSVVGSQQFQYIQFISRTENEIGQDIAAYDYPATLSGQVQAVPRELFERYGLDFQKNYLMFYVSKEILDVTRDVSGDQIEFAGQRYQCISQTNWVPINGWTGVIAVQITE